MKKTSHLTAFLVLLTLFAATGLAFALGRRYLNPILPMRPGLPPLSKLDLPSQTKNGYTATIEAYYADVSRLVFRVAVTGEKGSVTLDRFSLKDVNGQEINSSVGFGSNGASPFHSIAEFNPLIPLKTERFKGQLAFSVITTMDSPEVIAPFAFDLDLPIHPALSFSPQQTVLNHGVEVLLDRVIITPAFTSAYLCYRKPTEADWVISHESSLRIGNQQAGLSGYSLLFDSDFADGSKGGEPGWRPPVQIGRCVKIGFPAGNVDPTTITLTIPALEQSLPDVIPPKEAVAAQEILKKQGIEMEWHTVDHGAYPEYKNLPPGMSQQMALRKFMEALGYVYRGPWVFNLQIDGSDNSLPTFATSEYGGPTPIPLPVSGPRIAAVLPGRIHPFALSPTWEPLPLLLPGESFCMTLKHTGICVF